MRRMQRDCWVPEPRLETLRLTLRPPIADDLAWQLAWLNTPAVMRYLGGEVRPAKQVADGFERNVAAMAKGEPAFWTLVLRETGEPIGKCGLSRIEESRAPPAIAGAVQVGWSLAEPFWGQGLASEAARAALEYGFKTFELREIWAQTSDSNAASSRLMHRMGMLRCPEYDYFDPDYPATDNPTTVRRITRLEWDEAA